MGRRITEPRTRSQQQRRGRDSKVPDSTGEKPHQRVTEGREDLLLTGRKGEFLLKELDSSYIPILNHL